MVSEQIQNSPVFLVAKGDFKADSPQERYEMEKTHRIKLGSAIYMAVSNHGDAVVRAIGSGAIANAVRAITIASSKFKANGVDLIWESSFDKGSMKPLTNKNQKIEVTAIVFSIRGWVSEGEGENNE